MRYAQLTANLHGKVRREKLQGRDYLVAPLSLIVPGVLNGSQGPLYYPLEEVSKNPEKWNGIPIVVDHPQRNGKFISAKQPGVLNESCIGMVLKANTKRKKLAAEAWFDVKNCLRINPQILRDVEKGRPREVSTGLHTKNEPSKGVFNGMAYSAIARNYTPDHLAILTTDQGACSLKDGCGVNVNSSGENCGTGAGGFKSGNDCAKGKRGKKNPATMTASQINKELDKLDVMGSKFTDDMIAAGRGSERPNDYLAKDDELSMVGRAINDRRRELVIEAELRYGPSFRGRLPKGFGPRKTMNSNQNCGIGSEGFEQGNDCAKGKGGGGKKRRKPGSKIQETLDRSKAQHDAAKRSGGTGLNDKPDQAPPANDRAKASAESRSKSAWKYSSRLESERKAGAGEVDSIGRLDLERKQRHLEAATEHIKAAKRLEKVGGSPETVKKHLNQAKKHRTIGRAINQPESAFHLDPAKLKKAKEDAAKLRKLTGNTDCGTGAGGFKKGNTCAADGGLPKKSNKISYRKMETILKEGSVVRLHPSIGLSGRWVVEDIFQQNVIVLKESKSVYSDLQRRATVSKGDITHIKPDKDGPSYTLIRNTDGECQCKSCRKKRKSQQGSGPIDKEPMMANKKSEKERKGLIDNLIGNCACDEAKPWTEEDRPILNALSDEKLVALNEYNEAVTNALAERDEEEEEEEVTTTNKQNDPPKEKTAKEWMAEAPPEIRSIVGNAMRRENEHRANLITTITANESNPFSKEELNTEPTEKLEKLAKAFAPKHEDHSFTPPAPLYTGAAAPLGNSRMPSATDIAEFRKGGQDMVPPTVNFKEEAEKRRKQA